MKKPVKDFSVKILNDQLKEHEISLAFQGAFSQDVLTLVGANLKNLPNSKSVSKRLFALVIEMAQNIHHYSAIKSWSDHHGRKVGEGILAISESKDHYVVCSGNMVSANARQDIIARCKQVNSLNEAELKELYLKRRKEPQREDKPGANLGFIDMRRKSGFPLEYSFTHSTDTESFFILKATISKLKK